MKTLEELKREMRGAFLERVGVVADQAACEYLDDFAEKIYQAGKIVGREEATRNSPSVEEVI